MKFSADQAICDFEIVKVKQIMCNRTWSIDYWAKKKEKFSENVTCSVADMAQFPSVFKVHISQAVGKFEK